MLTGFLYLILAVLAAYFVVAIVVFAGLMVVGQSFRQAVKYALAWPIISITTGM